MKTPTKKRAPGGGRKPAYGEDTVRVTFRVPVSKRTEFRKSVNKILQGYKKPS